jgi:2-dehydro-3-deoxygluconokinase
MTRKTFVSIGECMAELQAANDSHYRLGFAGDTLNTAWYVKALTDPGKVDVEYLTAVGTDQLSQNMTAFLKGNKIGLRFIREVPDRTVGLYLITLNGAERAFTYWRSESAARLLADDETFLRAALSQADVIYFSGITLAILPPRQRKSLLSVLREMKSHGATIAFDSNVRRRLWPSGQALKKALVEGYKVATLALPTFDDDRALFGDGSPGECARRIAAYGVAEVVVKDGANPCIVLANGSLNPVAPELVPAIIDTTGAGDSFNAGYLAVRLSGRTPLEAAQLAHRVAGRVLGGHGALLDMSRFADMNLK